MSKITVLASTGRLLKNEYERPKKTITELSQNKDIIEDKLKDYREISQDELCMTPMNSHLRYISYDKKSKRELFRYGGLLMTLKPEYLILVGKGGKSFSVQRYTYNEKGEKIHITRFFRKLSREELNNMKLEETMKQAQSHFEQQNEVIQKQQQEIEKLKKLLKKK